MCSCAAMRSAAGPRGSGVFAGYLDAWGRKGLVWTGRARRLDASVKRTDGFPRQIVAARIFETRSELCFMWGVRCLIVFFTDQRLRPRPGKRDTLTYGALKPLVCAGLSSDVGRAKMPTSSRTSLGTCIAESRRCVQRCRL